MADERFYPLWAAARRRLEANGATITASPLVLDDLDAGQADAIAGLLGVPRPSPGAPLRVSPVALDRALRSSAIARGLVEVVETKSGPLRDRRAERASAASARARTWAGLGEHVAVAAKPELTGWLEAVRRTGLARRLAGSQEAEALYAVLDTLAALRTAPAEGYRLGVLAAKVTFDAHGLDRRRAAGALVVHALSWLAGSPPPQDAAEWRRTWADASVACDDLSCDVLVHNLPGWQAEPLRLTLRQVTRWEPPELPDTIFSCENPNVVAAVVDEFGQHAPPIVCVEGMPSTAAIMVLEKLTQRGAITLYHGDFDWRGLTIASVVFRKLAGATPWLYGAADYQRVVKTGIATLPLVGRPQPSPWDDQLASAMTEAGVALYEEQTLPNLLADLATRAG